MNPLKKFRWSAALAFAACALVVWAAGRDHSSTANLDPRRQARAPGAGENARG